MNAPQRFKAVTTGWNATDGGVAELVAAADGPAVLFADVEEALRDSKRLAWAHPIIDGSDDLTANRRAMALAAGLLLGKSGNDLVDFAMERCPE